MSKARQLPSGSWHRLVRVKGHKPISITRDTKKACDLAAAKALADLHDGKVARFGHKTLGDTFTRYADNVSSGKAGAKWEINRIERFRKEFAALPGHGNVVDRPFSQVGPSHISAWRDMRLKTVSEGTVKRECNLLRNICTVARDEWEYGTINPWKGVRLPRDNPSRVDRRVRWPTIKAIVRQLGYKTGEMPVTKSEQVAYIFMLELRTALRASEILRLRDQDIDMATRVLRVKRKTYYLTREIREVPFTAKAARLFRPLLGWDDFLFNVPEGSRDTLFRNAYKAVGVEGVQFRDARAEAATSLARKVDVLTLARILDHKDLKELQATYYRERAAEIAARI